MMVVDVTLVLALVMISSWCSFDRWSRGPWAYASLGVVTFAMAVAGCVYGSALIGAACAGHSCLYWFISGAEWADRDCARLAGGGAVEW